MGKWFSVLYDSLMAPLEHGSFKDIRQHLIHDAKGDVLEIGSGTGVNFPYYGRADRIIAIEPDPLMIGQSTARARGAHVPIDLVRASAEALPFPDNTFDIVVATLVFCTIPDPDRALAELRRVLKPGGEALFFEHVRVNNPVVGHLQDWLTPGWKRICGGCHLNRNTLAFIRQAGFHIVSVESHFHGIFLVIKTTYSKPMTRAA